MLTFYCAISTNLMISNGLVYDTIFLPEIIRIKPVPISKKPPQVNRFAPKISITKLEHLLRIYRLVCEIANKEFALVTRRAGISSPDGGQNDPQDFIHPVYADWHPAICILQSRPNQPNLTGEHVQPGFGLL